MYYGHMGIYGGLGMIIFWGIFIWFIVWLIRQNNNQQKESAIEITKKRYANGEITKKQFDEMKKDLES